MAYSTSEYILRPGINLNGIQGRNFQLYANMFVHQTTGQDMPDFQLDGIYPVDNCSTVSQTAIKPGWASNSFSFKIDQSGPTFTGYCKTSLQTPISISQIKAVLGESVNDIYSLNRSPLINPYSPARPSGYAPYMFSEWIGYTHYAEAGVSLYDHSTPIAAIGANYTLACLACSKDVLTPGLDFTTTKVEFCDGATVIATITSSSPWNYFKDYVYSANNTGAFPGQRVITGKFYAWNGYAYQLVSSYNLTIQLEGPINYGTMTSSYNFRTLHVVITIINNTASSKSFTFKAVINGAYTSGTSSAIAVGAWTTLQTSFDLTFPGRIIDPADRFDLQCSTTGTFETILANQSVTTNIS